MDIESINWDSKEEVIKAVKENGDLLVYASKELKNDREVVIEAIKQNGINIVYAGEEIKKDKSMLLQAIGSNSEVIREVDASLLGDKDFMLEAVKQSNNAKYYRLDASPLIYASEELKKDKTFVIEVIKQRGETLQYADYFKQDKDVVMEAVKNNSFALGYADESLRGDKEVVLEAVKKSGYALMDASFELKNDKEVVLAALNQIRKDVDRAIEVGEIAEDARGFTFHNIGEQLLQDEGFMLEAEKIMQGLKPEKEHTADEIAEGISPKQAEIDNVVRDMIDEQILDKDAKDKYIK